MITTLPSTVTTSTGQTAPLNMSVDTVAFSAHSDFLQTSEFIDILQPPYIVLVHGDAGEMGRLKQSLLLKYENKSIEVFSPKNGQSIAIPFTAEKIAKAVGKIAAPTQVEPSDSNSTLGTAPSVLSGLLIVKDFNHHIMDPADLNTYTQMNTSSIAQNLIVPFPFGASSLDILKSNLIQMYDVNQVTDSSNDDQRILKVSFILHSLIRRLMQLFL